jgi:CDP-glycerol glycerophosphotransferase
MSDPRPVRGFASTCASRGPLLSIVIPTYNLESYIVHCLDVITGQAFQNIEIIAVDGGSRDHTRELLEKRMPDEPRLSVIWEARIGPGLARKAGACRAAGEYVWFVDGDDQIAPDCLTPISEKLQAERPDILLINHAELRPDGTLKPGQDDHLLIREDGEPFAIAERPWLIDIGLVSWNKIVRREFLQLTDVDFSSSWPHEDVPVSCELLLTARRLSVLSHVCYYYRRQRPGSATSTGIRTRHFTVFNSWRPVLTRNRDRMREQSCDPQVSREVYHRLFERSVWHCTTILETAGYVSRADRHAFFSQISRLYAEHVPPGYRSPGGFRGVKFYLIGRGAYLGYAALEPLNRVRVAVQRLLIRP